MNSTKDRLVIALLISSALAVAGCRSMIAYHQTAGPAVAEKHHGPPPHAPAHGYRCKHPDGVELVYNSSIGVYVVAGYADVYFQSARYYRWDDDSWQVSLHIDKGWAPVSEKAIPPGLRKTHVCKKKK